MYFNEHEVGQAIRDKIADGTVKREDIFYCGKVKDKSVFSKLNSLIAYF